jgi:hypothetical protein
MPTARATGLLICAAAAALTACASSRFDAEPPAGFSLAGAWKLDHTASDDPQKTLALMRTEATKLIRRRMAQYDAAQDNPRTAGRTPPPDDIDAAGPPGAAGAPGGAGGPQFDPLRRSPMAHIILAMIARGDFLTIKQSPTEMVFDYGTSRRSFTPGGLSVVSADNGVADQRSGWKGKEYIVTVRSQMNPTVEETYSLAADGKQLIEQLEISSGELPSVHLKRVYLPTGEAAPRQLPTGD